MINVVIFSKDRAMQLEALLSSMARNVIARVFSPDFWVVSILYTWSNPEYCEAYEQLKKEYTHGWPLTDDVKACLTALLSPRWVLESKVKMQILAALDPRNLYSMFLCDDDIFYQRFDGALDKINQLGPREAYAPRLGRNLTFCWNVNKPQKEGELDFDCTLSVDGHIYRTQDIRPLVESINIQMPHDIENNLWRERFKLYYAEHSCLVGIPHHRVQNVSGARDMGRSGKELNDRFLNGERIDLDAMDFSNVYSCHQPIEYVFKKVR